MIGKINKGKCLTIFLITILNVCAFMVLLTNKVTATATEDGYEPDNDYKEAHIIRNAQPQQHSIYPVTDQDWLELRIDCESDVTIKTSGSVGDTEMWLFRQDLSQIAYDDDSGLDHFSRISVHLTESIYYIKIGEYGNNNEISEYSITASYTQRFQSIYGGDEYDLGYSVQQTSDGGYIIGGHSNSYSASGFFDFYLVKTDSSGNLQWSKTFGGTAGDEAYSAQQTSDGGYIIAGFTYSSGAGNSDFYLVKTDSDGNLQWSKTFGGTDYEFAYSAQQTSDGGYIIAGGTGYDFAYDFYLVKTDSSGNLQWSKTFGGTSFDFAYSVQQTSDGGYIVAGVTDSYGNDDAYLVKTDSSGNLQWSKTFGGTSGSRSVQQTSDGGYIVAGKTEYSVGHNDFYLVKTDSSGNLQWSKTFGGTDRDFAYSVQQTSDGGYVVVGYTQSEYGGDSVVYLVKTDSNGDAQWSRTFEGTDYALGFSVQQTSEGGYVLAGLTGYYSGAGKYNVYLVKTDSNGYSPPHKDNVVEEGTNLVPQVVYTILHDPPGDGSKSYLEQTETQSFEVALSVGTESSVGVKAEAKFLGNGVSAAGEVSVSASTTISEAFVASYSVGYTSNEIYDDPEYIGPGYGDTYFGEAWLFHYRIFDRTYLNGTTERLMEYGPTRESHFLVSATWIKDNVEETWRDKLFALNPGHDNHISTEEQENVEHMASIFVTGGNRWTQSYEVTGRKKVGLTFSVRVSTAVAVSCGFKIIPGTEIGATVEVEFAFNIGMTLEASVEQRKRIGFEIYDDDGQDGLSTDVWYDKVFGTYLFTTDPSLTSTSNPREYSDNFAPNTPSPPLGANPSYVYTGHSYSTSANDQDGDNLIYEFSWGDGTPNSLTSSYPPNATASTTHIWQRPGTYNVTARAKDVLGVWSDWSDATTFSVEQNDANTYGDAGDSFGSATYISPASRQGTLYQSDPSDWNDWYKFNVQSGKKITVTMTPPPNVNFDLELYDPAGVRRAQSNNGLGSTDSFSYTADSTGNWAIRIFIVTASSGEGKYDFGVSVYTPSSGGGCPILYVFNGTDYSSEGLLDIHNPEGIDLVVNHTLVEVPQKVQGAYLLRLVEHPQTISHIDQVSLYALLEDGTIRKLQLIYAWHSENGNMLPRLLFSDDLKAETLGANWNNGASQSIQLRFQALPSGFEAVSFTFQMEGNNRIMKY